MSEETVIVKIGVNTIELTETQWNLAQMVATQQGVMQHIQIEKEGDNEFRVTPASPGSMDELIKWAADFGSTMGRVIPFQCKNCMKTSQISEYGGNLFTGVYCPKCNGDPFKSQ